MKRYIFFLVAFLAAFNVLILRTGAEVITHTHEGDASTCGGCYTEPVYCGGTVSAYQIPHTCGWRALHGIGKHYNVGTCPSCQSTDYHKWDYGYNHSCGAATCGVGSYYVCGSCGYTTYGGPLVSGYNLLTNPMLQYEYYYCSNIHYTTGYKCEVCGQTYDGPGTCSRITGYAPACGYEEGETIAEFNLPATDGSFTNSDVTLSLVTGGSEAVLSTASYLWDDGSTAAERTVSENGTYACDITVSDGLKNYSTHISTVVDYIDKEAPTVSISAEGDLSTWYDGSIRLKVRAEDTGSGLPENAYSYDGGQSFVSEAVYTVSASGTYGVTVVDRAGNTASANVTVTMAVRPVTAAASAETAGAVQTETVSEDGENGGNSSKTAEDDTSSSKTSEDKDLTDGKESKDRKQENDTKTGVTEEETDEEAPDGEEELFEEEPPEDETLEYTEGVLIPEYFYGRTEEAAVPLTATEVEEEPSEEEQGLLKLPYAARAGIFGGLIACMLLAVLLIFRTSRMMVGIRMKGDDGEYHYIAWVRCILHQGNLQMYLKDALTKRIGESRIRLHFSECFMKKYEGRYLLVFWKDGQEKVPVERELILHIR